jgi:LPS-assembly lipoprotein
MWLFDRRTLLALALAPMLAAAGCGFTPAFAPGGPAVSLQNAIQVQSPTEKNGFDLVERLEQRLGRSRDPALSLAYRIKTAPNVVGITQDNAITRFNITGAVNFVLTDIATGAALTSGTVESFTSYSASGTTVSTLAAERDAETRLMRLLADQIVARLVATSGTWAK